MLEQAWENFNDEARRAEQFVATAAVIDIAGDGDIWVGVYEYMRQFILLMSVCLGH